MTTVFRTPDSLLLLPYARTVRRLTRKSAGLLACLLLAAGWAKADEIWVGVDTDRHTLSVLEGGKTLFTFENISVGRDGVTAAKIAHDHKTPLGTFHIRHINQASRFHLFFGLDYPNPEQAESAYLSHRISAAELEEIYGAHRKGEEPSADTPLGGGIGIHGIGHGDPRIHEDFNWTDGCIALTNEQVDELSKWVSLGTRVVIYASLNN